MNVCVCVSMCKYVCICVHVIYIGEFGSTPLRLTPISKWHTKNKVNIS